MAEAAAIDATIRSRLGVVLDASATVVSACAAWIGVYAAVAPAAIARTWASMLVDPNHGTDRRVGLLAVMHEALKNCARRSGADDVIRQFLLAARREVPPAVTSAISLEPDHSEFRRSVFQAVTMWKTFAGFFPAQWVDRTLQSLAGVEAAMRVAGSRRGVGGDGSVAAGDAQAGGGAAAGGGAGALSAAVVDSVAAEASGLAQVLRYFQKYNAALERLRRFESDPGASAAAIESVRDDVVHRAQPLLSALGSAGGKFGLVPSIEAEVRRVQQAQQQATATAVDDGADPLADFFS